MDFPISAASHNPDRFSFLTSVLEKISDVILVFDASGKILYAGPSVTKAAGYSPQELHGRSMSELLHPEDFRSVFPLFMKRVLKGAAGEGTTMRFRHKDGALRFFECLGKNALDDPLVQGVVVSARDVTEVRLAESVQIGRAHV